MILLKIAGLAVALLGVAVYAILKVAGDLDDQDERERGIRRS